MFEYSIHTTGGTMPEAPQAPGGTASPPAHLIAKPGVALGVIVAIASAAQFMAVLDTSIVLVALPAMRHSLGLSANVQQWVVDGYLVAFGGFLLLAARASDLVGRVRVFQAGVVLFSLASLVGGLATDGTMLLIARAVQGLGAAALAPVSLSLITASHAHATAHQRTRALAIWTAAGSSAGAAGMIIGGVLTAELSWRWIFFVNVPLGGAVLAATIIWLLPASATGGQRTHLDLSDALAITLSTGLLVYGVSAATEYGWGSAQVIASLAGAAALLAVFILIERRSSHPLVRLGIFRNRGVSAGSIVMLCAGVLMTATFFFLSLYFQQVLGYSALRAGLAMVPMTVLMVIAALACRALVPRLGVRKLALSGALPTVAGLAWLTAIPAQEPTYMVHVLVPTLLIGAGLGLMLLPANISATAGLPPHEAGLASGLVNVARQIGGAVGLAALVTAASTASGHALGHVAIVHGYHVALAADAGIAGLAGVAALFLPVLGKTGPRAANPGSSAAAPVRQESAATVGSGAEDPH
jgi:EmrB/QacA subfamily drug resistance transporter